MKTNNKKSLDAKSKTGKKDDFKSLSMPELLKKLDASTDGLTNDEAKKRLT